MTKNRIRICRDYGSTQDFFSYLIGYAPSLPVADNWTFEEAYADFRLGILDCLEAANVQKDSNEGRHLLMLIEAAYKLFKEERDRRPARHLLHDAEEEFARLCSPGRRRGT
jgi:hypothetical protein